MKSWRQKLNAADAPVSITISLESVSNDTSSSNAPLWKPQRRADVEEVCALVRTICLCKKRCVVLLIERLVGYAVVCLFVLCLFNVDVDEIERDNDEPDKEEITSERTDLSSDNNGGLVFLLILDSILFNPFRSVSGCIFQRLSSSVSI